MPRPLDLKCGGCQWLGQGSARSPHVGPQGQSQWRQQWGSQLPWQGGRFWGLVSPSLTGPGKEQKQWEQPRGREGGRGAGLRLPGTTGSPQQGAAQDWGCQHGKKGTFLEPELSFLSSSPLPSPSFPPKLLKGLGPYNTGAVTASPASGSPCAPPPLATWLFRTELSADCR